MPQSLSQIHLHLIYSTKNRVPYLRDPKLRNELYRYVAGICNNQDSHAYRIGGVADHIHIHCRLGRTIAISELIRELKRTSSIWLQEKKIGDFAWQVGYGAFSIGAA